MIKYLVMDVDGTLTDGKIYISEFGEAMKAFNIKDGCGIHDILPQNGIVPVVITGRQSKIVSIRCHEIGIQKVFQGVSNKEDQLHMIFSDLSEVAYIGDDINDLCCIQRVKEAGGIVGCPADAVKRVIELSNYVAPHNGGDGAVRDFIEWLILHINVD